MTDSQLRAALDSYRATIETLVGRAIPAAEGPLECLLVLMRENADLREALREAQAQAHRESHPTPQPPLPLALREADSYRAVLWTARTRTRAVQAFFRTLRGAEDWADLITKSVLCEPGDGVAIYRQTEILAASTVRMPMQENPQTEKRSHHDNT